MPAVSEVISPASRGCKICGVALAFKNYRDLARKKFCSKTCHIEDQKGRRAVPEFREDRECALCHEPYVAVAKKQKYCSQKCMAKVVGERFRRSNTDLASHIKRLLVYKGRKEISLANVLSLYEKQKGLCALTGIEMTWGMFQGRVQTHLSIDRISSDGGYTLENIQLVCVIANKMKQDLAQQDFINLCKKIVEYANANDE